MKLDKTYVFNGAIHLEGTAAPAELAALLSEKPASDESAPVAPQDAPQSPEAPNTDTDTPAPAKPRTGVRK